MNPSNFDKFPSVAQGPPSIKYTPNSGDDSITTEGYVDRYCNDLTGQASIDESIRSIQELIDTYKNR